MLSASQNCTEQICFAPGDLCVYEYDNDNKSCSIVQIEEILNKTRGVAKVRFLRIIRDDSGNGLFTYLYENDKRMNVSLKHLKKIVYKVTQE